MHRPLSLALAASLALTASACMSPTAKQSSAAGAAGERAAQVRAGGVESAEAGAKGGKPKGEKPKGEEASWWQRLKRRDRAGPKPWHYGDVRPGKGLLGNDADGYTLYRQGEAGSSDPDKPSKTRRR